MAPWVQETNGTYTKTSSVLFKPHQHSPELGKGQATDQLMPLNRSVRDPA